MAIKTRTGRESAFTISTFKCEECGNTIPLPRGNHKQREKNHIKHVYCIKCKKETAHIEKREFDY